jgi:hypothetical protein
MDSLGGYRELSSSARVFGDAVFLAAVALTGLLERLQLKLKESERAKWWASSGRDLINLVAFVTMTCGLWVVGFTGAIAICIAATLLLMLVWLQSALGTRRLSWVLSLAVAAALAGPVIAVPKWVDTGFRSLLQWLYR